MKHDPRKIRMCVTKENPALRESDTRMRAEVRWRRCWIAGSWRDTRAQADVDEYRLRKIMETMIEMGPEAL